MRAAIGASGQRELRLRIVAEHAPQAIRRRGIRAVLGESFAEIFFGNSVALGLPCVTAEAETIDSLMETAEREPSTWSRSILARSRCRRAAACSVSGSRLARGNHSSTAPGTPRRCCSTRSRTSNAWRRGCRTCRGSGQLSALSSQLSASPEATGFAGATSVRRQPRQRRRRRARRSVTYYAGAASGGIRKTTDGGITWDRSSTTSLQSIGALAVAPSDPHVSGPAPASRASAATSRSAKASTSPPTPARRGRAWGSRRRAASAHRHPSQNPDIVLACALGHAYGPQQERGVFRTTDGGKTWERVLFVDENTGCSELDMDPEQPAHAVRRHVAVRDQDVGPRERRRRQRPLHVERRRDDLDAAARAAGCRRARSARSKVAIAPSNPDRVYAMIETGDGVPLERQGDRSRSAVAIGRRRRELARGQLRPQRRWAARTTTRTSSSRPTTRTRPTS